MKWSEIEYWNSRSYGSAYKIKKFQVMLAIIIICTITPFTNWIIPIAGKKVPSTIMYRY